METAIQNLITARHRVLHLSIHSFAPVLDGRIRRTDIGLLFDPRRNREREFCTRWRDGIRKSNPGLSVHFNLPYRGSMDGLTSAMRKRWREDAYLGIELEVNQKFFSAENRAAGKRVRETIVRTLLQHLRESAVP